MVKVLAGVGEVQLDPFAQLPIRADTGAGAHEHHPD
jgi:hypothetical protein